MALDPRGVAVQGNAGVELPTVSMVSGRFRVFHQLSCADLNKERTMDTNIVPETTEEQ